jgi:gliding motility-associated-like protein
MQFRYTLLFLFFSISQSGIFAQNCTTLGQNPSTAFPVCGTGNFTQNNVPICGGRKVPTNCRDNTPYEDTNPFWYKFTCFSAGTLGFVITPFNLGDDYDWQLFDITGKNPDDVFSNPSLIVCHNWSGESGRTGALSAGTGSFNCGGTGVPLFNTMPVLLLNHEYLLLVSHFTVSQSGYTLSFTSGTASITDPTPPALKSAKANCDGMQISVALNKKMKCNSLSADGTDFTLAPANATVIGAAGNACNNGFDLDSLTLTLSNPLPAGNYTLTIKNGTDGNTLLDNCAVNIPSGSNLAVNILPIQPTLLDSITPVKCVPDSLQLVFKKPIRCSSIAADGSDFVITGPQALTITGAFGKCNADNLTNIIFLKLSAPISKSGTYIVRLKTGADGNTIIDECGQSTPINSATTVTGYDTVNADFNYQVEFGCVENIIRCTHNGLNNVNKWNWTLDGAITKREQNPVFTYREYGARKIQLSVSNGVCSDSSTNILNLNNELKAAFKITDLLCPEDTAQFIDKSIGDIINWNWSFGDNTFSDEKNPPGKLYSNPGVEKNYTIQLIVRNSANCLDTLASSIRVVKTCFIAVPNAFSPNGDQNNDYLFPLNAYKADNLEFKVYNRLGRLVFQTKDWTKKWDGTINGQAQGAGIYVWTLSYINKDTKKYIFQKGTTLLLR